MARRYIPPASPCCLQCEGGELFERIASESNLTERTGRAAG